MDKSERFSYYPGVKTNLKWCNENADSLLQRVLDAWALHVRAGNKDRFDQVDRYLHEKAFAFRTAKLVLQNHVGTSFFRPTEILEEITARREFASAYQRYYELRCVA